MPFNIACGRCRNCKEGKTGICLNVNPARPGAAYGYVDMGGWVGGQAEYVMVPYADFNLLKFPDKDQAMAKIKDLTLLSDIFPTGYHGAVHGRRRPGQHRLRRRRGPGRSGVRGLVPAAGRGGRDRRRHDPGAPGAGEELRLRDDRPAQGGARCADQIEQILGVPEVDCAVDCVGFEARGHGRTAGEAPATVLNSIMEVTRAGGRLGIPGLYVTGDPGGVDENAKIGSLGIRIGLGWAKIALLPHRPVPGDEVQPPADDGHPARQDADRQGGQRARSSRSTKRRKGYKDFDKGAAKKFVIDPHGMLGAAA